MNLHEFIAKQLNDHHESPSGVEQATYTEWTYSHIDDAITMATMYLYTIIPNVFTDIKTKAVKESSCLVSFCDDDDCDQFIEVLAVGDCEGLEKVEVETNDLLPMFDMGCKISSDDKGVKRTYQVLDNMPCVLKFKEPVPVGTELTYVCAKTPTTEDMENSKYAKYLPLIADYALWWLYRTDTESRSNLQRASMHFESVKDFVTNTLLMEFTLRDDGYNYGRRRTDGNANMQ